MISSKMADRINLQINREMYSAYLYLAMGAAMTEKGYTGVGKWFTVQYHEEMFHAMKFAKYLQEQGAAVKYAQLEKPAFKDGSLKEYFEQVLKHEQFITSSIREIVELARAEKDYATENLLQWYINEQVEEEANDNEILQTIELMGSGAHSLFMLNIQLGKRENGATVDFTKI